MCELQNCVPYLSIWHQFNTVKINTIILLFLGWKIYNLIYKF